MCLDSDIDIFKEQLIIDIIDYKWNLYAQKLFYFGGFMHFCFTLSVIIYVNQIYILNIGQIGYEDENNETNFWFTIVLLVGIMYPMCYDLTQLVRSGWDYFGDIWNYNDFLLIQFSLLNIVL